MSNRGLWLALVFFGLLLIGWLFTQAIPSKPSLSKSTQSTARVLAHTSLRPQDLDTRVEPAPALPAAPPNLELPPSLAGTEIDGAVELDTNGQLRPTQSLRRLFDQVLTLIGERSIDEIRALLVSRLDVLTTADGKRQALAAFERYLRYLQAQSEAAPALKSLDLTGRLAALKDLRRQQLGSEMADAFFADEEAYQQFTLAQRELSQTPDLTAKERASRERDLVAQLPESARLPLLEQRATELALADAQQIESQTNDADELERLRAERFGAEAAVRMQALDQERALWQQRISAYQAERARIRSMRMHSGAQQSAIDEYLSRRFDEAEQRRIRSLEAIGEI